MGPSMRRSILVAAAVLLLLGLSAGQADAADPDTVAVDVAHRYGVTVLRVTPTTENGRPAFSILVMNPGGDDNGAFKVTTLMVDAETGQLISQFAHRPDGYQLPSPSDRTPPPDDSGPAIRRLTEREYRAR
jgi:hypothetical protein